MAMADMICIARIFFLLRPGEYTGITTNDAAFSLNDVYLYLGKIRISLATATDAEFKAATSCALYFAAYKNLQKGDVIAKSSSHHFQCRPVKALVLIVLHH